MVHTTVWNTENNQKACVQIRQDFGLPKKNIATLSPRGMLPVFFFPGIYLEFFKKFQVLRSGKCRSTWNFLSTWKFVGQIWPEMLEIQREIGVKQRIWSKISACGGPNKREGIKTIDFETGLKKIPGTPKSKKKHWAEGRLSNLRGG